MQRRSVYKGASYYVPRRIAVSFTRVPSWMKSNAAATQCVTRVVIASLYHGPGGG